jgi:hypothetical protein
MFVGIRRSGETKYRDEFNGFVYELHVYSAKHDPSTMQDHLAGDCATAGGCWTADFM